jgi:hypothetical protein
VGGGNEPADDAATPDAGEGDVVTEDATPLGEAEAGPPPPTGIVLGVSSPSATVSPSSGGMNYTDLCATDDSGVAGGGVVIGFKGTVDAPGTGITYLRSLAVVCGILGVTGSGPVEVTIAPGAQGPVRGNFPGAVSQDGMCPPNQVVVGFDSRAAMYVDQLTFRCAPLTISLGPQGYALSVGTSQPVSAVGGSGGNLQGLINCADGAVVVGSVLRAGDAIDSFGVACASPTLVFAH